MNFKLKQSTYWGFPDKSRYISVSSDKKLPAFPITRKPPSVGRISELCGHPAVYSKCGRTEIWAIWDDSRNEWIGLMNLKGWFTSVTRMENEWSGPYELSNEHGVAILTAYKISSESIDSSEVLRTSPNILEQLGKEY
jgi:hypothetical protein